MRIYEDLKDKMGVSRCLEQIGLLHYNQGENVLARTCLEKSRNILADSSDKGSLARVTMHIGSTFAGQNDHKMAVSQFSVALVVGESVTGGWVDKVDCLQAMGTSQVFMCFCCVCVLFLCVHAYSW
jgi:hypothetical protein